MQPKLVFQHEKYFTIEESIKFCFGSYICNKIFVNLVPHYTTCSRSPGGDFRLDLCPEVISLGAGESESTRATDCFTTFGFMLCSSSFRGECAKHKVCSTYSVEALSESGL